MEYREKVKQKSEEFIKTVEESWLAFFAYHKEYLRLISEGETEKAHEAVAKMRKAIAEGRQATEKALDELKSLLDQRRCKIHTKSSKALGDNGLQDFPLDKILKLSHIEKGR